jgi:hypothetical protein
MNDEDGEADLQNTYQSIINLVAVDSDRISEAIVQNYFLSSSIPQS